MSQEISEELRQKILKIKAIACDVDGVLTDGTLVYHPDDGGVRVSGFNVHDGLGIRTAIESGLHIVWISGNWTDSVKRRAEDLRITGYYLGVGEKTKCLRDSCRKLGLSAEEYAFVGDDLNDIAPMRMAGLPVAVQNATHEVKQVAAYVTEKSGGTGAVREIIELIMRTQNTWDAAVEHFLEVIGDTGFYDNKPEMIQ